MERSEIRESTKIALLTKVRNHDYGQYLYKASIQKIRGFTGEDISFEFPVTALIGPNGSGKSSVLGAAGCAYKAMRPGVFFPKCAIGDESMAGWRIEYELVHKQLSPRQLIRRTSTFRQAKWARDEVVDRPVLYFGIERTVPAGEKARFRKLTSSRYTHTASLDALSPEVAQQVEHVLGKTVADFRVTLIGTDDQFLIGRNGSDQYSEFHFGAGESSIIRMISEIENAPANSLVLIEEIENGLHPIATRRMVEYLIDVAERKSLQAVFTTHSDYALSPLPNEAIWACISGNLKQGKLSVESLRAVSGRVDKQLAIFVEDEFAKRWTETILREKLGLAAFEQVEIHAVAGDGTAVSTHLSHARNPAIRFQSLCIIDGDSEQVGDDDPATGIIRLPGAQPELSVYESVRSHLAEDLVVLTVSCQRPPEAQAIVQAAIEEVIRTNRDPHLLYVQLGMRIGLVPEAIVRGAFLALWVRRNQDFCNSLASRVQALIAD